MIPKIIHYCWFGRGPKPPLAEKCIASWRKFLPDYKIKEWNEDNFDVNCVPYAAEAYAAKMYAFVSDYARFKILHEFGGIYFDTDVEVIRPLDDILDEGPFMGLERNPIETGNRGLAIAPGLGLAVAPGLGLYRDILDFYSTLHFKLPDGSLDTTTIVLLITRLLVKRGFVARPGIVEFEGIRFYPAEYFNPKRPSGRIVVTKNTRTIHHFSGSWQTSRQRFLRKVNGLFGRRVTMVVGLLTRNPLTVPSRVLAYLRDGK